LTLQSWSVITSGYNIVGSTTVKNEPDIEMAIADEVQNFKEYGGGQAE
jgi:hypothetical protein